jgi:predicted ATPase
MTKAGVVHAFTGTHSTGKTTAVRALHKKMHFAHPDKRVGIVREVARDCPYPVVGLGNSQPNPISQQWIFHQQAAAELAARARYDIVICDRTVCDCIAYTLAGGLSDLAASFLRLARWHVEIYDRVIFRRARLDVPPADDGFRNLDNDFRLRVEGCLLEVYHRLGVRLEG